MYIVSLELWCIFSCFFHCFWRCLGKYPPCCFILVVRVGKGGFSHVLINVFEILVIRSSMLLVGCDHSFAFKRFVFCNF
jgi:hypothetical protein